MLFSFLLNNVCVAANKPNTKRNNLGLFCTLPIDYSYYFTLPNPTFANLPL